MISPSSNGHTPLPAHPIRAVLDTDAFNEVDDQFTIAYSLLSPEHIRLEACYAAPFSNARSSGPAEGMEKSYAEIENIFDLIGHDGSTGAFRGANSYLTGPDEPVASDATNDLIRRAMTGGPDRLYVMGIAVATNIASAILIEPRIIDRIVVIWLGGHPHKWFTADEFNLRQDVWAAQVLFDSGVPLVHIPCKNVAEHLRTSLPDLNHHLPNGNPLCDYLKSQFRDYTTQMGFLSKPLWDISVPAFLIDPKWVKMESAPSPVLTAEKTWRIGQGRHPIQVATEIRRDAIFSDMLGKLQEAALDHASLATEDIRNPVSSIIG